MKTMYWILLVLILIAILVWCLFFRILEPRAPTSKVEVMCDQGDSLADAIRDNPNAQRFEVVGECKEQRAIILTTEHDNIQIVGRPNSILTLGTLLQSTFPVLTIEGTKNARIEGVMVTGGRPGLLILGEAEVLANGSSFKDNSLAHICLGELKSNQKPSGKTWQYSADELTELCTVPPIPIGETPQYKSKPLSSSSNRKALIQDATAAGCRLETSTAGTIPPSINICNVNFLTSVSDGGDTTSGIVATCAIVNSHPSSGEHCTSRMNNHGFNGLFLKEESTFDAINSTLQFNNNGQATGEPGVGLGAFQSSISLNNSTVESKGNRDGVDVYFQDSGLTCVNSEIDADNVIGDISGC